MSDKAIQVLSELFGNVADDETIKAVVRLYNGKLTPAIEALMKLTQTSEFQINGNTVNVESSGNTEDMASAENNAQNYGEPSSLGNVVSYRVALDKNKQGFKQNDNKNVTIPKAEPDHFDMYSNKSHIRKVVEMINKGYKVIVLLRGLPGSGKSTLAKNIVNVTVKEKNGHIFSSDDFFIVRGKYVYNRERVGDAHEWNKKRVLCALSKGVAPVIIDNTNLEVWEMQAYVVGGVQNGYIIEVIEVQTPWTNKPGELSRRGSHNVPVDKIKRMQAKYEKNTSGDNLIQLFHVQYPSNAFPPQVRRIPIVIKHQEGNYISGQNGINVNMKSEPSNALHPREQRIPIAKYFEENNTSQPHAGTSKENERDKQNNFLYKDFNQMTSLNCDFKYMQSPSKPQRSNSGNRRDGLLKGFSDVSEWKSIDDWESIDHFDMHDFTNQQIVSENPISYKDAALQTVTLQLEDLMQYKVLIPVSRSINTVSTNNDSPKNATPCKKFKLDKGIMTDNEVIVSSDNITKQEKLKELKQLFEYIPNRHLLDILEKCNGDINWACEILLDADINGDNIFANSEQDDSSDVECVIIEAETDQPHTSSPQQENLITVDEENDNEDKKEKNASDICDLKKQIEENFVICDDYYSEHVRNLRKKIHGTIENKEIKEKNKENEQPASPTVLSFNEWSETGESSGQSGGEPEEEETGDVEDVETVSVRVGHDFIGELNRIYKTPYYDCTLEPVIHIPANLLNQIHALWLESLCDQIDAQKERMKVIIKEDEEFARKLAAEEEEEEKQGHHTEVPNLKEIMEMEMDLARYNMAHSEWKKESPNDFATKLSKQKLIQLFPDVNENILIELLHAYNYNFGAAFEDLLLSTGRVTKSSQDGDEINPKDLQKILAEQERDLIQRTMNEKNKELTVSVDTGPSTSAMIQDPKELVEIYRKEAKELMALRNNHHQKAQEYLSRKMYGTANYYSNLANLYSKKHDYVNTLAASEIVQINTKDNNTLDLHCFYVKEALQALDMYLDVHIRTLRERNKKPYTCRVFLITGRGNHSPGNQARIKPAIKKRLKERSIRYGKVNPGLLSVVVSAQDVLTDFI